MSTVYPSLLSNHESENVCKEVSVYQDTQIQDMELDSTKDISTQCFALYLIMKLSRGM